MNAHPPVHEQSTAPAGPLLAPPRDPKPRAQHAPAGDKRLKHVISTATSITAARKSARELAVEMGFSATDSTLVAAAISELAQNIVSYAKCGMIEIDTAHDGERVGLKIIARDRGPGIGNVRRALLGGYSTSDGMGLGLASVRRIMDEMEVKSSAGKGTTVAAMKWLRR